jgi:hypothetical protein
MFSVVDGVAKKLIHRAVTRTICVKFEVVQVVVSIKTNYKANYKAIKKMSQSAGFHPGRGEM